MLVEQCLADAVSRSHGHRGERGSFKLEGSRQERNPEGPPTARVRNEAGAQVPKAGGKSPGQEAHVSAMGLS